MPSMAEELRTLEARKAELEASVSATAAPEPPALHPGLAEVHRRKVGALREALSDEGTRAEAVEVLRTLIEEVRLVPVAGELRVELVGALPGILAL